MKIRLKWDDKKICEKILSKAKNIWPEKSKSTNIASIVYLALYASIIFSLIFTALLIILKCGDILDWIAGIYGNNVAGIVALSAIVTFALTVLRTSDLNMSKYWRNNDESDKEFFDS